MTDPADAGHDTTSVLGRRPVAILFDIDGTLLVDSSSHLAILAETLSRTVGTRVTIDLDGERPRLDGRDVSGWIDAQVVRSVLEEHRGSAASRAEVRDVIDRYGEAFRDSIRGLAGTGQPVPGAEGVLEALRADGVRLALVTGNAAIVARSKLEAVALDGFFVFDRDLGFGDWREDRGAVARAAIAGLRLDGNLGRDIALVGDTVRDIHAALRAGVRPIGVTTGVDTSADLMAAGATTVLSSLSDLLVERSRP